MSYLSMSDEQVMAMGGIAPEVVPQTESTDAEHQPEQQAAADTAAADVDAQGGAESAAELTQQEEADEEAEATAEGGESAFEGADAHAADQGAEEQHTDDAGQEQVAQQPKEQPAAADLPEGAGRIFETFRANGRDMKVKSVDEAIRLMQMGANYSQKQAGHKKDRALVRVLEQHGLQDQQKLAFAVDLINGNPEAIGKLIKDTNFDVHEIDDAKVAAYRAESKAPSAHVQAIEDVVDSIRDHQHFGRLNSEMQQWDEQSQAMLGQHPRAMAQLVEQMESGVYDTIMDEVNHRQVLGQLVGVPLMQAYNDIGREFNDAGRFAKPAPKGPVKKLVTPGKKASPASKADEERRRAAAPSKGASTTEAPKKVSFLDMSDADFVKYTKQ